MRRAGFTLIELLIVVALIGVLVSIAIPSFQRFHHRAKSSEARTNLGALRTAEEAYMGCLGSRCRRAAELLGRRATRPRRRDRAAGSAPRFQLWGDRHLEPDHERSRSRRDRGAMQ